MRAKVDPSARVEATAIGSNVTIGPYCTVGPHVTLGEGCRLVAHVNLTGHTSVGPRTVIHPFASLGSPPQSVHYRGEPTRLVVGADCDIRENVTMSVGTEDGGGVTEVGDRCFFMVGSHVGHDCKVGSNVVLANNVLLGGHVIVGDHANFGGGAVHRMAGYGRSRARANIAEAALIVFGDDLHRLQDFAQVGAVGHDVSRIPQRLEVKCRIGEEKSPWGDRGRGTWWRWRSTAALGCLHGGSEASGGQTGRKDCQGGASGDGGVAYGHLHLLRSGNFMAPRMGAHD